MAEEISLWSILTGVFMPVTSGLFGLLWTRQGKHEDKDEKFHEDLWEAINAERKRLTDHQVTSAKEYATQETINALKSELKADFNAGITRIEQMFDRHFGDRHDTPRVR